MDSSQPRPAYNVTTTNGKQETKGHGMKNDKTENKNDTGAAVWASIRQAERHAHVTNGTIRAAVKRGEIKAYKRRGGKGVLIDLRDVDTWIRNTWNEPTANEYAELNR